MNTNQPHPFNCLNTRNTHQYTQADLNNLCADLKTRMKQLDELIARNTTNNSRIDNLPDDVKAELEVRSTKITELTGQIEEIQQKMIDGVNNRSLDAETTANVLIRNKTILDQANAIMNARGKFRFEDVNARNIVTLEGIGGQAAQFAQNDLSRTVERPLNLLDVIAFIPVNGEYVPLFRESAYEIMADVVEESKQKPESNLEFGIFDLKTGTIAHWIKVSKQLIADMPTLAAYIEGRLAYGVRLKLEYKIVNGDTNKKAARSFIGLLEDKQSLTITAEKTDTNIDVFSRAKAKACASGILPEAYVLNPEDWGTTERIKGSDGHYLFGAPGSAVQPVVWGLPVILSGAVPVGKYWCGNLTLGVAAYTREDVSVELSTEDSDNFTKNLCTILAEMRAASGVVLPDACVSGDLPNTSSPKGP